MLKNLFLLLLATVILLHSHEAFSSVSVSQTYKLSVTLPDHVMLTNTPSQTGQPQLTQTKRMLRGGRMVAVQTIVVP